MRIRRKKCKRFGRSQELSDVYLEMGDHLRQLFRRKNGKDPELLNKAISKYKNSIEKSKFVDGHTNSSLAYRALAEIALEKGSRVFSTYWTSALLLIILNCKYFLFKSNFIKHKITIGVACCLTHITWQKAFSHW